MSKSTAHRIVDHLQPTLAPQQRKHFAYGHLRLSLDSPATHHTPSATPRGDDSTPHVHRMPMADSSSTRSGVSVAARER
ncbi:hypothetical protein [Streptomyces plicatus]|uniref:hypothetical protein n=1 Tax=Streptomyces plicatus TaxID=1922 RepID=UPI001873E9A3|nr:hypothetical protein [Streptomyces plicatus]GGZ87002.1 hypothetical protein GCM10010301_69480 [Streptomyces plicatus]